MGLEEIFRRRKSRIYPIQRDAQGLSLRQRCFDRFEKGQRPANVAKELGAKNPTVFRYFTDWRRLGPNFDKQLAYVKELFKKTAPDREKNIELFVKMLGIDKDKFEAILEKPYGLKQFLAKRFYFPIMEGADHKRHVALQLGILIAEHLVAESGNFQDVYFSLRTLMHNNMRFRQDKEDAIREYNQFMGFARQILQADLENERKGAVQPDRLTDEEINRLLKFEIESLPKKMETLYWKGIAALMMKEKLTREQAREKMYQDLQNKGDLAGAKALRSYQNIVHPLKTPHQSPPPSPIRPPLDQ